MWTSQEANSNCLRPKLLPRQEKQSQHCYTLVNSSNALSKFETDLPKPKVLSQTTSREKGTMPQTTI